MALDPRDPLIVQADRSILVDVHAPRYDEARARLARFAELEKSPEHMHTYRLSPLALWNAAATGLSSAAIVETLREFARYPVPSNVLVEVSELLGRYGKLRLAKDVDEGTLRLDVADPSIAAQARAHRTLGPLLRPAPGGFLVDASARGEVKRHLLKLGFPVDDRAGFSPGRPLAIPLARTTRSGRPFALRAYQEDAVRSFLDGGGGPEAAGAGGHGVVVLPCGAGKTVIGLAAMARLGQETLILTTGTTSARQWIAELRDKTGLPDEMIGEYSGEVKQLRPVTVTTYQIVTRRRGAGYPHFEALSQRDFGLLVYDEVHLVPAPMFRLTAEIQARRRLGLTATLVREDGLEGEVFSLIGPKRFDVPWREVEAQGFIAEAACYEVRVTLLADERAHYDVAAKAEQHRLAATSRAKLPALARLAAAHPDEPTLVIGTYLDQLAEAARLLGAPLITGDTPQGQRERLLGQFRSGELRRLVLSRVGNFSIDLPDASVCIQVSGSFGSRQEEAQRLGRVLRPKADGRGASFYTLVARDTVEQRFAMNRQLFLTEQGYRYYIESGDEAAAGPTETAAAASTWREPTDIARPGAGAKVIPFPSPATRPR